MPISGGVATAHEFTQWNLRFWLRKSSVLRRQEDPVEPAGWSREQSHQSARMTKREDNASPPRNLRRCGRAAGVPYPAVDAADCTTLRSELE